MHKTELYKQSIGTASYMGTVSDGSTVADVIREIKRAGRRGRYERTTHGKHGSTHHVVIS